MGRNRLIGVLLVLASLLTAAPAVAMPYLSGHLGAVWVNDASLSNVGFPAELSTDTGYGFSVAFGNSYGNARAEIEMAYRYNDLAEISSSGVGVPVDGDIDSLALLVNMLFDFSTGANVKPFIGAGIGFANVESELTFAGITGTADDTVLAYQLIAGIGVPLSPVTTLELQYKYFGTDDPNFDGIDVEYQTNNVFGGLRLSF